MGSTYETIKLFDTHCIYALVNEEDKVFFIGSTDNFEKQKAKHLLGKRNCSLYKYTKEIENKFTMEKIHLCNYMSVNRCEEQMIENWSVPSEGRIPLKNMKLIKKNN